MLHTLFTSLFVMHVPPVFAAPPAERFFDSCGVRIRFFEQGAGDPVVLIHGFSDGLDWAWKDTGILAALSDEFRVIALDCRGHGGSDKPHEAGAYGEEMVEDVARLLDHLGLEQAHIVGYSMGGRIALKFLADRPDRVLSAALIAPSGTIDDADLGLIRGVADSLERGEGVLPLVEAVWPRNEAESPETCRAVNDEIMRENDARALALTAREYPELAVSEEDVRAIDVPVLALVGAEDPLGPAAVALGGRVHDLDLRIMHGADHLDILREPRALAALAEFLEAQGAAPSDPRD